MFEGISQIVVGVDLTEYSKSVFDEAQLLAAKVRVPIVLVYAFEGPIESDWQRKLMRKELNAFYTNEINSFYKLKDEKIVIKYGKPYKQILTVAKSCRRPLIIVGHRGETQAIARFFLGSTAERLALNSKYPLIICRGKSLASIKKILIPSDLSDRAARTLKGLKQLGFRKINLEMLHVVVPPPPIFDYDDWSMIYGDFKEDQIKAVEKLRKKFSPIRLTTRMSNDIAGEIYKYSQDFDLIAISPGEKKSIFSSFGSVTAKVVRSGETSILIVP